MKVGSVFDDSDKSLHNWGLLCDLHKGSDAANTRTSRYTIVAFALCRELAIMCCNSERRFSGR